MALPKRRHSRSRQAKRRANWKSTSPTIVECTNCHPKIFHMSAGSADITMDAIYKGGYCGVCHDGRTAFDASKDSACAVCHTQ